MIRSLATPTTSDSDTASYAGGDGLLTQRLAELWWGTVFPFARPLAAARREQPVPAVAPDPEVEIPAVTDKALKKPRRPRKPKAKQAAVEAEAPCFAPEQHDEPAETAPLNAVAALQTVVESAFAPQTASVPMASANEDALPAEEEAEMFLLAHAQSSRAHGGPHVAIRVHEGVPSRYAVDIGLALERMAEPSFGAPRVFDSMAATLGFLEVFDAAGLLISAPEPKNAEKPCADDVLTATAAWLTMIALRREYRDVAGALIEALACHE
jgi:hypothetical protein